ncbi:MAG: hypothetical protein V2I48_01385 [Xanthomonadales bacterium]|jgi:Cu/Ag efflux protein CusF|nr:hypothetical protein [Xanthomonadales bacterium]
MKTSIIIAALFLLLTAPSLQAGPNDRDIPSISTTQKMKLTAQVMAVDLQSKEVTLKGPEGDLHTLELPEATRLDEVEVGDTVLAKYVQHLTLELYPGTGAKPGHGTMSTMKRAADSEQPGGVITETSISMATVNEIDLENGTFKLEWEDGIKEYIARDPENLKKAKVGDYVVATYTAALGLELQEVNLN